MLWTTYWFAQCRESSDVFHLRFSARGEEPACVGSLDEKRYCDKGGSKLHFDWLLRVMVLDDVCAAELDGVGCLYIRFSQEITAVQLYGLISVYCMII